MSLPAEGSVLGVDVGYSLRSRTSAVCRLDWTDSTVSWTIERYRGVEPEREEALARVADRPLLAAAFDGPLKRGFETIGRYRACERMLTAGWQKFVGKPGQSNSPIGGKLNEAANIDARHVVAGGHVVVATHAEAIDDQAIVEAFPTCWLGLMIDEPGMLVSVRSNRSDVFYERLADSGGLQAILDLLLAGRRPALPFAAVTNHDDRAGLVCALTALCVAAGHYSAVGDADGWIILPPRPLIRPWAWKLLEANAAADMGGLVWYPT